MKLTKKENEILKQGIELSKKYGYWSKEVYDFNNKSRSNFKSQEKYMSIQNIMRKSWKITTN